MSEAAAATKVRRECSGCTLCCKLIPVHEINKTAGARCEHQRATGCRIYNSRPMSCRVWSCGWLINDVNGAPVNLSRPDRSHYVIDCMPDYITVQNEGQEQRITVMQVWCDPDYPDAHRDPALRAWLDTLGAQGIAALVRFDSSRGVALIAPSMPGNHTGKWIENSTGKSEGEHDRREIASLGKLTFEGLP